MRGLDGPRSSSEEKPRERLNDHEKTTETKQDGESASEQEEGTRLGVVDLIAPEQVPPRKGVCPFRGSPSENEAFNSESDSRRCEYRERAIPHETPRELVGHEPGGHHHDEDRAPEQRLRDA